MQAAVKREVGARCEAGFITRNPAIGFPVSYMGLRLIRKGVVNSEQLITEAYERTGQKAPAFSSDVWNFDVYYNRIKNLHDTV